jgi:Pyruvate kinase, alpha/beta domain
VITLDVTVDPGRPVDGPRAQPLDVCGIADRADPAPHRGQRPVELGGDPPVPPVPRALASNADPMTAVVSARRGVRSRTSAPIPLETVRTMARIIEEVESDPTAAVPPLRRADRTRPGLLVQAALDIAYGLDATALVAFTLSGNTVRRLARLHPGRPLIAITPNPALTESARAELGDGARPRRGRRVVRCDGADRRPGGAGVGRIRPGEGVVIVAGAPPHTIGLTDLFRVHRLGAGDTT